MHINSKQSFQIQKDHKEQTSLWTIFPQQTTPQKWNWTVVCSKDKDDKREEELSIQAQRWHCLSTLQGSSRKPGASSPMSNTKETCTYTWRCWPWRSIQRHREAKEVGKTLQKTVEEKRDIVNNWEIKKKNFLPKVGPSAPNGLRQ